MRFFYIIIPAVFLVLISCHSGGVTENKTFSGIPEETGNVKPDPGISIFEAALNGDISRITGLLSGEIDVNAADEEKRTALMYAAYNGHVEILRRLLDKGALVNLTDTNGRTALMLASSGPFPEAVKLLLDHNSDPDIADKQEHFTALMYAAAEGHLDVVRVLLSYRADPALKDIDGDNARIFAGNNGHKEIEALLRSLEK